MGLRVTQTTIKRLDKLDAPLRTKRNRSAFVLALHHGIPMAPGAATFAQRTVLSWPAIALSMDDWETQASQQQDALIASSCEDRGPLANCEPVVIGSDPADVTHCYKVSR